MEELTCDIARDLMPLVLVGTASGDSKIGIAAHIRNCEVCRAYYEGMYRQMSLTGEPISEGGFRLLSCNMKRRGKIKKILLSAMAFLMIGVIRIAGQIKLKLQEGVKEDENGQAYM